MEQYDNGIINVNAPAVKPKTYRRLVPPFALPSILAVLIFVGLMSTYPVHATTGDDTETAVTTAPGGASVGPAENGTNVTATTSDMQSACLPQNATTTTGSPPVNGSGANATTTNNTTATVAPSGASIGANDASTLNATTGNTTTTTNNTTATVAPSGASVC